MQAEAWLDQHPELSPDVYSWLIDLAADPTATPGYRLPGYQPAGYLALILVQGTRVLATYVRFPASIKVLLIESISPEGPRRRPGS